jgi:hypothetical protein
MARLALMAIIALALGAAWRLSAPHDDAVTWPRIARAAGCAIIVSEPRRDQMPGPSGEHTLRIAFLCLPDTARPASGRAAGVQPIALRGTATAAGTPAVERGAYAMSGARAVSVSFPTAPDPDGPAVRECRDGIESLLSGLALRDGDPLLKPMPGAEPLMAGPDSRVYALRDGAWWREEPDGSWSRLAPQGSAAARRDARLAPLERTMAERQLRDGR